MIDARTRFSDRVANYIRYRPSYPPELVTTILDELDNRGKPLVADLGSGTGIFTQLLLERGLKVYAIEPNTNMRLARKRLWRTMASW